MPVTGSLQMAPALDRDRSEGGATNERMTYWSVREGFRQELTGKIEGLMLIENVAELDMNGYTVLQNAAPPAFFLQVPRICRGYAARSRQALLTPL